MRKRGRYQQIFIIWAADKVIRFFCDKDRCISIYALVNRCFHEGGKKN